MNGRRFFQSCAFLLAALVCLTGCATLQGEPLREAAMDNAAVARPATQRGSVRIDLADQETEGFHFRLPAGTGVEHWSIELLPAAPASSAADPVAAPAPVAMTELTSRYFLTPRFYDCVTVDNPLATALGNGTVREHVPDALIPMSVDAAGFRSGLPAGDLRANRHVWVELTWQVDADAAQKDPERLLLGRQVFRIRGHNADGQVVVDLGLHVHLHDFTLPVQGRFRTMVNWNTTVAGYYNWKEITPEQRRKYYAFFLRHRLSPTSFHAQSMEPPLEDLPFCAAKGLNCINLYTIGRQKGMLPQTELDAIRQIGAAAKEPLVRHGLDGSAFVLVCNAAELSDVDTINTNTDTLHEELPWARVWLFAAPNDALSDRINAWCTLTAADTKAFEAISYDADLREKYAAQKDLNLWYVGQEPGSPYVNLLLSNASVDAHLLALQTWANNIAGLTVSHATAWPWEGAARADFPAREWRAARDGLGLLCYPLPDGEPCPSARLINLRDGLEHAEVLREAEFVAYNLGEFHKLFEKITLPFLEDHLRDFDNIGHTDDLRNRLGAKLALTRQQQAAIPGQLRELKAVLELYHDTYKSLKLQSGVDQAAQLQSLRRRLYRILDTAEPLSRQIQENLNDPLVRKEPEKPADEILPPG